MTTFNPSTAYLILQLEGMYTQELGKPNYTTSNWTLVRNARSILLQYKLFYIRYTSDISQENYNS